jgi:4-hydroxysphinganine ceramide fatty acyl 2-hydroxylase
MNTFVSPKARLKKPNRICFKNYKLKATMVFYSTWSATFLYLSSVLSDDNEWETGGLYISGMLIWTLLEYFSHRLLYYLEKKFTKGFIVLKRYFHHQFPEKHRGMFAKPFHGASVSVLMFSCLYLIIDFHALALMAGVTNGYLFYSYIHYSTRSKRDVFFLNKLKAHHRLYHYRHRDKIFETTSSVWNKLFGTMPNGQGSYKPKFYSLN